MTEIPDRQPARHLASCTRFLLCLAQAAKVISDKKDKTQEFSLTSLEESSDPSILMTSKDSKSDSNMAAEPIDPTAPRPSSAMALTAPGANDEGKGDTSVFNISSGTSSPFTSPDLTTRKRRSTRSASPSTAWPFPGRKPSPVRPDLFERVVHRRCLGQKGRSTNDAIEEIEEQLAADREYMEQLKDAIVTVNQRLDAQRATTHEVRDWGEKAAASIVKLGRRTQEDETHIAELQEAMKRADAKVVNVAELQEAMKRADVKVASLPDELGQTLDKRLSEVMNGFKVLDKDVGELKQHVAMAAHQQKGMGEYLQQLDSERPAEGRTVVSAFQHLENEVTQVKNFVSQLNTGARGGGAGAPQEQFMMNATDGWKCHCDHVAYHETRLNELERTHTERIDNLFENVAALSGQVAAGNGAGAQGPGPCAPCGLGLGAVGTPCCAPGGTGHGATGTGSTSSGAPSGGSRPPPMASPPGETPPYIPAGHTIGAGGNGECHCRHVIELQREMRMVFPVVFDAVGRLEALERGASRAPLIPPGISHGAPQHGMATPATPTIALPLSLGPLGGIETGRLFEDKMASQDGFQFDGQKGGDRWKGKVERYFISKAPALKAILTWAEKSDMAIITEALLEKAVGQAMTLLQRETVNGAIWGFLSNCVSAEAETMFKRAETLNGIDAWRRLVRHIDHGRSIRLEAPRTEVRSLHLKPIKSLEAVAIGIAEFENKINEYIEAGGRVMEDDEMKADLLAILPEGLRENLLWRATDPGDFSSFRNMVQAQAAKVLLNRRRLPVHRIEHEDGDDEPFDLKNVSNVEDLIAAFQRLAGKGGRSGNGQRQGQRQGQQRQGERLSPGGRPLKCPNCGEEHAKADCKKPMLPVGERKCWTCGKKGCVSARCPERKKSGQRNGNSRVSALGEDDDVPCFGLNGIGLVADPEGFTAVQCCHKKPQPRGATVADFVSPNVFQGPRRRVRRRGEAPAQDQANDRGGQAGGVRRVRVDVPLHPRLQAVPALVPGRTCLHGCAGEPPTGQARLPWGTG